MSLQCRKYSIVATACPCQLVLEDSVSGNQVSIDLRHAVVRELLDGNFVVQGLIGTAMVDAATSSFTASDIRQLICDCGPG